MNIMVPIALFGWIPTVLLFFWTLSPRRAVLAAFLIALLFLPDGVGYKIPMLPIYTKATAATLGTLLGMSLFDWKRLATLRPCWIDLPIAVWCIAKFGSSVSNGYGAYDGLSSIEYTLLIWGLPWLCGRLYFSDREGAKDLAMAIVIGGLLYVPLCLFEVKMSPQLNGWVYGGSSVFSQAKRFGGWRPIVFMQHGLMVGMWMCMSGLTAWWLWLTGSIRRIWKFPILGAALTILATAVLCRSFGAIALLAVGTGVLWIAWKARRAWALWAVWAFVPLYMALRLSGAWSGAGLVDWSATIGDGDRGASLQSRLDSENGFIQAAWHKPLLGFHGWYNTIQFQGDNGFATPDALWMIELTGGGLIALASLTAYLLWPPASIWWRSSKADWRSTTFAPVLVLSMVVTLWMIDNLFNAMLNPMFMLAAGSLAGWRSNVAAAPQPAMVRGNVSEPKRLPAVGAFE